MTSSMLSLLLLPPYLSKMFSSLFPLVPTTSSLTFFFPIFTDDAQQFLCILKLLLKKSRNKTCYNIGQSENLHRHLLPLFYEFENIHNNKITAQFHHFRHIIALMKIKNWLYGVNRLIKSVWRCGRYRHLFKPLVFFS